MKYQILTDETEKQLGIYAVACVKYPAIKKSWTPDDDTQTFTGPLLIPDFEIYKNQELTIKGKQVIHEYFDYYTAETIEEIGRAYMKKQELDKLNVEHGPTKLVGNVIELWIKRDEDWTGSDIPVGSLMCSIQLKNKSDYDWIKQTCTGFSIEGYFLHVPADQEAILWEALSGKI